jgi:hypothetical protein
MMANLRNKQRLLAIINHIFRLYELNVVIKGEGASVDALKDLS